MQVKLDEHELPPTLTTGRGSPCSVAPLGDKITPRLQLVLCGCVYVPAITWITSQITAYESHFGVISEGRDANTYWERNTLLLPISFPLRVPGSESLLRICRVFHFCVEDDARVRRGVSAVAKYFPEKEEMVIKR